MKYSKRRLNKAKKKHSTGKSLIPWERVLIIKEYKNKVASFRIAQTALSAMMGAFQIATLNTRVSVDKFEKAMAIVEVSQNTANAISNASKSEPNIPHPFVTFNTLT